MGFLIILAAMVGIFVASEFIMAHFNQWGVLSQKYRLTGAAPSGWRGCRFLQVERQQGNTLIRGSSSVGPRFSLSLWKNIWMRLFPTAYVFASSAGLYIKRQPWNFLHPAILIPWTRVSSVKTLTGTEHATEMLGRRIGVPGQAFRDNIPGAVASVANTLSGDIMEVRLTDPVLRIFLPASSTGNLEQYVTPKPATAAKPTPSPVGAR